MKRPPQALPPSVQDGQGGQQSDLGHLDGARCVRCGVAVVAHRDRRGAFRGCLHARIVARRHERRLPELGSRILGEGQGEGGSRVLGWGQDAALAGGVVAVVVMGLAGSVGAVELAGGTAVALQLAASCVLVLALVRAAVSWWGRS